MDIPKNYLQAIIYGIYEGILEREPEKEAIETLFQNLSQREVSSEVLRAFVRDLIRDTLHSEEFYLKDFRVPYREGDETFLFALKRPSFIYLHIPKCAGFSLWQALREHFGEDVVNYPANALQALPLNILFTKPFVQAHTDYDTIKAIFFLKPHFIFTFLREPSARLKSLYRYFRGFDTSQFLDKRKVWIMELAKELSPEEFYSEKRVKEVLWNEMTRRIMGEVFYKNLKKGELALTEREFREAVRERLREFFFIGLVEDFERGLKRFFELLGKELNFIPRENLTPDSVRVEFTSKAYELVEELTYYDKIIYEEAESVYESFFTEEAKQKFEIYSVKLKNHLLERERDRLFREITKVHEDIMSLKMMTINLGEEISKSREKIEEVERAFRPIRREEIIRISEELVRLRGMIEPIYYSKPWKFYTFLGRIKKTLKSFIKGNYSLKEFSKGLFRKGFSIIAERSRFFETVKGIIKKSPFLHSVFLKFYIKNLSYKAKEGVSSSKEVYLKRIDFFEK